MTDLDRDDLSPTKRAEDIHDDDPEDSDRGPSLVGKVLSDRYRIERHLGEGAMGAVYLAEHTLMHKRVAIKVLHGEMSRSAEVVARFEREAVAAGHIEHPNVASASDFGKLDDGSFFLVLEYIEGIGLRDLLEQYGVLPAKRALHIVSQVCSALVRAHGLGIVHRDLKPENVMLVDRSGDPDFVKVLDFGIARVPIGELASELSKPKKAGTAVLTRAGMVYGTPEYMAPEQALGQDIDARADLYALGVMLYELLTGERPFFAESKVLLLGMHVTAPIPPMRERAPSVYVDPELEGFVRRLLAKDAAERPQTAQEVETELLRLESALGDAPPRTHSRPPPAALSASQRPPAPSFDAHATTLSAPQSKALPLGDGVAKATSRRNLTMGAVAAGAFLLFAIPAAIVLMRGKAHDADAPTDGGAMVVELPKVERNAADAIILFERGEVEAGKAKLAKSKTPYEAPEVQRAVAIGAFSQGRNVEAIQALTLLAQKKPDEVVGETFLPLVKTAAAAEPSSEAAMKLLEEHPNERVTDALYTLSIPPNARPVMDRADKALRNPLVRAKASKALEVALSLKDAGQDCNAVQYFDDAAKFGDERALEYLLLLEPLKSVKLRKVPGHYRLQAIDEYACLRKDKGLAKAIAAIRTRTGK